MHIIFSNEEFAVWASSKLGSDHYRHTHRRDIVVHSPLRERYMHIAGEFYEDPDLSVKPCVGYEDESCSYQWILPVVQDHLLYLGKIMGEAGCP
jgi:hypothetical protein